MAKTLSPKVAAGHRLDPVPHKGGRGQTEEEVAAFEAARFHVSDKKKVASQGLPS